MTAAEIQNDSDRASLEVGSEVTIDLFFSYRVEEILEGGMGFVLILSRQTKGVSPFDLTHRPRLALKSFKGREGDQRAEEVFLRELNIWLTLQVPNIARLIRIIRLHGRPFAMMPVYECNLSEVIRAAGVLSMRDTKTVVRDVISCLECAFDDYGAVHLDLKPENILVEKKPQGVGYVVSDWGISRLIDSRYFADKDSQTALAALIEDLGAGTVLFMSPERLLGAPAGIHADIYSLGLIIFFLVTGSLPFFNQDVMPIEAQIVTGQYWKILEDQLAGFGKRRLRNLILGMTHPNPDSRIDNYRSVKKSLRWIR